MKLFFLIIIIIQYNQAILRLAFVSLFCLTAEKEKKIKLRYWIMALAC